MKRPGLTLVIALASLGAATVVPANEPATAVSPRAGTPAATAGRSSEPPISAVPEDDAAFVRQALRSGRQEVADSRNAVTRATREDVRSMAQMLMTEHMSMNAELESLADRKGWKAAEPSAPPQDPGDRDGAPAVAAADFDNAYVQSQIRSHQHTITLFRGQSTAARDADVRQLAAKALPKLEQHLAALQRLAG
jgi:putative membrane protein